MPYAKNTIKVKVQNRSGFDKSHRNSGTLTCGTITPILCDELIPNSRVSLKLNMAAQLPPLVSDTYMNCKLKAEAFFVPSRLLCKSFESFFCDSKERVFDDVAGSFDEVAGRVPVFSTIATSQRPSPTTDDIGKGSLADYLGLRCTTVSDVRAFQFSALPFLAYHLVWSEWYRNPRVQNPAFVRPIRISDPSSVNEPRFFPYVFFDASNYLFATPLVSLSSISCADGWPFFSMRQRNFGQDYFTGARLDAQQGSPASVTVNPIDGDSERGSFTIAALRAANSLQMFRERNNLPSSRLVDQVKARYGANLSDGVAQRPICIGAASYDIGSRGVDQTAGSTSDLNGNINPFSGIAAQYGRAYASGSDFIIDDFVANEPGYLLVNVTLVPEATYGAGVPKMFQRYMSEGSITDMANPILQNVGDQPIDQIEISGYQSERPSVFGYQDRYADWMYIPNSSHGEMRPDANLKSFVLQRSVVGSSTLTSDFLEIPKDFLDDVLQVRLAATNVSAWYDCYLQYHVSMPLAEWSLPSLIDPGYEHGQTVTLVRNGQIF